MKRNIIHIMIALFAIIGTQSIYAQRVINQQGGDITINEQTHHVDGEESYTNFTITAPSAGNYYINFWVLPTEYANGTSMAAPHVAGLAALILERNPNLTGQQVRNIIEQNTTKVDASRYPYSTVSGRPNGTWNQYYGYGLINAYEAVKNTPRW